MITSEEEDVSPFRDYIMPKITNILAWMSNTNELEYYLHTIDKKYINLTCQFPCQSLTGNKLILGLYKSCTKGEIIKAFTKETLYS